MVTMKFFEVCKTLKMAGVKIDCYDGTIDIYTSDNTKNALIYAIRYLNAISYDKDVSLFDCESVTYYIDGAVIVNMLFV